MQKKFKSGAITFRSRSAAACAMLKRTNKTQIEIAKAVGITPQTVNAYIKKYGIVRPENAKKYTRSI